MSVRDMTTSTDDRNRNPRHTWWYRFFMRVPVRCFLLPIGSKILNIRTERYRGEMPRRPFIMVFNHASDYDFIGTIRGIPEYGRYIMSDELIKMPLMKIIINCVTNGIYRRKGENADKVVDAVKTTLDKGINVYFAAEGEESFNGATAPIRGRTGSLIKEMNVDVITYRMEGGYFIKPKWTQHKSKGPMFGKVVAIHTKEELAEMSPEEVNAVLSKDLWLNVYDWQKEHHIPYDRKDRAEWMEKILYKCPKCEGMYHLKSEHHDLFCTECGYRVSVNEYGLFEGNDLRFDNLYDWDVWQKECLKSCRPDWERNPDKAITSNDHLKFVKMNGDRTEILDEDVHLEITFKEIIVKGENTEMRFPLDDMGLASVRNGIGISYHGTYYKVLLKDYQACMLRYRTIRRIIMNRNDY